jgi:hypothetical protein
MVATDRRSLLLGSAALFAPGLLAACATPSTTSSTTSSSSGLSSDVTNALNIGQAIDAGLIKAVADTNAVDPTLISTSLANAVEGDLTLAGTGITALLGATPPPAGASTLTQIATYFEDATTDLSPILAAAIPGSAPIIGAIDAIETLLPVFEAVITTLPAALVAKRQARLARRPRPLAVMSTADALAVLHNYLAMPPATRGKTSP